MTSDRKPRRCFVYITLPGEVDAVTAARYELKDGVGRLVYGRSYLARDNAVDIDPVELKLGEHVYQTAMLGGIFGALRDASPDYWGRSVIERALGRVDLDEVDFLLQSSHDRAGALAFGHNERPPEPKRDFNQTLDLKKLQDLVLAILNENKKPIVGVEDRQAKQLLSPGTSMGGARPKAIVEDGKGLWIAKFNAPKDRWNNARVEHAMLRLAKQCGIASAESRTIRIGDRDALLVKRFDRKKTKQGYLRSRMVSALTILQTNDSPEAKRNWSYPALAEELRRVCASPREAAKELFLRMCFNALISNTDDHPRNHAVIAWDDNWHLSPAYDLTPAPSHSMERDLAMIVGDNGRRATAQNLLSQCGRFLLKYDEAWKIVSEMETVIRAEWYAVARSAKVTVRDCEVIRSAFENKGFSFAEAA